MQRIMLWFYTYRISTILSFHIALYKYFAQSTLNGVLEVKDVALNI